MKEVDLFCGISSLGLPFPKENKDHIGYYDIIKKYLIDNGYEVNGYNISSLNKNHTWDLEKLLNQNYLLSTIRNIQIASIDALRNTNLLFKLIVPKEIKEKILLEEENNDRSFKDIYQSSLNPIFLYSGGPNDFFTFIKSGPVELLSKDVRDSLPSNLEELVMKSVDNVMANLSFLYQLNNNVEIFVLGYYDSPLYDKIQKVISLEEKLKGKNYGKNNKFLPLIELFNSALEQRCNDIEHVNYIDISFLKSYCAPMDFHPNTIGNELIAEKIIEKLKQLNYYSISK